MRHSVLILTIAAVCVNGVFAGYDYVMEDGYGLPSLHDTETLLMTGGGAGVLVLWDYSFARIEGTSPLQQGFGGIWTLGVTGYSHLEFYGGEVHEFSIGSYATAMLAGGRIDIISSTQNAYWNPHIEIVCDIDSVHYDPVTKMLTGNWLDGTAFSTQLIDVEWASPTIENIFFTPEPATLLLLGLGSVLLRRRLNR